ncbi:MAG TPA: ABC transporter permease, partial [Puia sp.]
MLKNYLVIAWRSLSKHKLYSAINIVGLAVGMAACIVIFLFVYYERSFDSMHSKNLYRLNEVQKFPGMVSSQKVALSMFPMGPTLKHEFPEIKNYTRINWHDKQLLKYGEKRIYLPMVFMVDSAFLDMFDFPLKEGNRQTALWKPNSAVLTESAARKIFGSDNPMGKTFHAIGQDTLAYVVTGILKDIPSNSQLQFDGLFSFNTVYKPDWMTWWGGNWLNTYFELAPNTNTAAMEKKFPDYLKKYMTANKREDGWKYYELFLLPFKSVHANSADIGLDYINYQKFDKNYTNIFVVIALIVLAIACINFMNLSTARSAERAKEVGIRKSIGAHRFQLGIQFLGETVMLSLIALLIAAVLVFLVLPYIENLSQRNLKPILFEHAGLMLAILFGTIGVGLISGLYPAIYLSSFKPTTVLKGSTQVGNKKSNFRNILVVGQFVSAIFLIIATIFVFRQFNFMRDKDPGFSRDQVVTIPLDNFTNNTFQIFKEKL